MEKAGDAKANPVATTAYRIALGRKYNYYYLLCYLAGPTRGAWGARPCCCDLRMPSTIARLSGGTSLMDRGFLNSLRSFVSSDVESALPHPCIAPVARRQTVPITSHAFALNGYAWSLSRCFFQRIIYT